jgi:hypothetical protein
MLLNDRVFAALYCSYSGTTLDGNARLFVSEALHITQNFIAACYIKAAGSALSLF